MKGPAMRKDNGNKRTKEGKMANGEMDRKEEPRVNLNSSRWNKNFI